MARTYHFSIDQGTTVLQTFVVNTYTNSISSLVGYTGESQLRKHYSSSNSVEFTVSVNSAANTVSLSLTANASSNIAAGRYLYDIELTSNTGVVTRLVEGIVTVNPEVTR